jgi:nucleoside-diphosphate-sugar epimerase
VIVAIAGGHGKVALRLTRLLSGRGDTVIGLIRKPDHAPDVEDAGGKPVVLDLERDGAEEFARAIAPADAVVFAAGAGPGSGPERKWTVDRDGAIKLLEAAKAADVARYLMISSIGADNPPDDDEPFSVYLRAKAEADAALVASDRDWLIVRPGFLDDDPGTGHVTIDVCALRGEVPRDDVAATLAALLDEPNAKHRVLYVIAGDDPIEAAIAKALA